MMTIDELAIIKLADSNMDRICMECGHEVRVMDGKCMECGSNCFSWSYGNAKVITSEPWCMECGSKELFFVIRQKYRIKACQDCGYEEILCEVCRG